MQELNGSALEQLTREVIRRVEKVLESSERRGYPPAGPVNLQDLHSALQTMRDQGASRLSCALGAREIESDLSPYIDHTNLKPDATKAQIRILCEEAVRYGFASVCINPYWVRTAARVLAGCPVSVCTVAGFPLGATTTSAKAFEAAEAVRNGATEIDMVINVGELKARGYGRVAEDIAEVVRAATGKPVKVIIETALLNDEEKVAACAIAAEAGADFVKTSTGFAAAGATAKDVTLMRRVVGPRLGVKAAGGIRTEAAARAMLAAGASRLGTSASVKIVSGD